MWPLLLLVVGGWLLKKLLKSLDSEPRHVDEQYRHGLVLAFFGPASSGKSTAVKCLFGVNPGRIHPIPGTTRDVQVWRAPGALLVADTPGTQDTSDERVQKTRRFMDNVDIFVYVVNANGGIGSRVAGELEVFRAVGRPLLVVLNKIDTIPDGHKRNEFINHQRSVAGVPATDFIVSAFDPLPAISREPMNVKAVRNWIQKTVRDEGEDLLKQKARA